METPTCHAETRVLIVAIGTVDFTVADKGEGETEEVLLTGPRCRDWTAVAHRHCLLHFTYFARTKISPLGICVLHVNKKR